MNRNFLRPSGHRKLKISKNLLVQACDLALHFTARLVQAMVLGALTIDYEKIISYLRKIAECWQGQRSELEKTVRLINDFKQMIAQQADAWKIWKLIE